MIYTLLANSNSQALTSLTLIGDIVTALFIYDALNAIGRHALEEFKKWKEKKHLT